MGIEEIGICLILFPIAICFLYGIIQFTIKVIKTWKEQPLSDAIQATLLYLMGFMFFIGIVLMIIGDTE